MNMLVETEWLAAHLGEPDLRVIECTVYLQPADVPGGFRVESGRAKWAEGHIPGAGFVDLQDELSDRDREASVHDDAGRAVRRGDGPARRG